MNNTMISILRGRLAPAQELLEQRIGPDGGVLLRWREPNATIEV